ncbi:hypothetical protein G4B88_001092 [Cannabis sativa]|uniref:B box-type domain-containing protein n=1 Tax=Cannabis sativa TaxID=3483 RepID=A0A7J6DK82_CANSA|nr:hypothetical protein G4B88_001092 [Cannabis sativa]
MKDCELCGLRARMYCESDQASLCWDCDEKVHGANFLVAKHSRSLLCHVCNFPTPWMASGAKLTPTVSVCESCVDFHNRKFEQGRGDESGGGNDEDEDEEDTENETDISDEDDYNDGVFSLNEDEIDEEGENQVVPWSPLNKRPRLTGEDYRSSARPLASDAAHDEDDGRDRDHDGQSESRSTTVITSIQRLQNDAITDVENSSNTILEICKLSRDQNR